MYAVVQVGCHGVAEKVTLFKNHDRAYDYAMKIYKDELENRGVDISKQPLLDGNWFDFGDSDREGIWIIEAKQGK